MKKLFFLLFSAIIIVLTFNSAVLYAQFPTTTLRVVNTAKINDTTITFEVYFKNTSADSIQYATGQYFWDFNKAYLNGTATMSILASGFPTLYQPKNPTVTITTTPGQLRFATNGVPGAGNGYWIRSLDSLLIMKVAIRCPLGFSSVQDFNMLFRKPSVNPYTNITLYIGTTNTAITSACTFHDYSPNASPTITWQTAIKVTEVDTAHHQNIVFGFAPTATNGLDATLGEAQLPSPVAGAFDARFDLPGSPLISSLKDFRNDTNKAAIWAVKFQPSTAGGYPFTLTWDPASLPAGFFRLVDNLPGPIINVNMKTTNSVVVTDASITGLQVRYSSKFCKDISLVADWNMFGVPVNATSMSVGSLLPLATSPVYGYNGAYTSDTALAVSKGYWVQYPAATIPVCGLPVVSLTVPIASGWNMIAVHENDVPVAALTTTPAGITNNFFFGYNNGYSMATTLQSGKGYWILATQSGTLNLPAGLFKGATNIVMPAIDPKWSSVQVSDAAGNKSSLYFAPTAKDINNFVLPPVPPTGIFDVRFTTQSCVENITTGAKVISLNSATYPVEIRAVGIDLLIKDNVTGKFINKIVKAGTSIVIANENITSIEVSSISKPVAYELQQNFPNPFNPSTMIRFGIPENARVRLTIYNQIGEQVAELVNGQLESGYHQVIWNAANMSSGVYFYQIKTEKYSSVKKLLLLK